MAVALGRVINELRKGAGFTQADLGKQLGITGQQLSKYELGQDALSVGTLVQMAGILGVRPEAFFQRHELGFAEASQTPYGAPLNEDDQAFAAALDVIAGQWPARRKGGLPA